MYSDSEYCKRKKFNSSKKCINNDHSPKSRGHISVTPQMIRLAVKKLQLRKVYVNSTLISQYLRHRYPIDSNLKTFTEELKKKLDCAVHVGLIIKHGEDDYCLPTLREEANILKTMFTAFWEMYQNYPRANASQSKNQNPKRSISKKK
nr:uncharacterized protein LOC117608054 [Osmia lignaria]